MQTTHRLLGGEAVRMDVPDAVGLPGGTSIGVLALDGAGEMEVTSGREGDLAFFLEVTGTTLDRETTLRDGRTLRHGRFGGDPAQGLGWSLDLDGRHLYGFTLAHLDLEALTGFLGDIDIQVDTLGPVLTPAGRVTWSDYRAQKIAQVVELSGRFGPDGDGGVGYLLDSRRTRTGQVQGDRPEAGVRVRGGLLTRSSAQERHRYGVLESADFVTYGLPGQDEGVDAVLTSLSEVVVEVVQ